MQPLHPLAAQEIGGIAALLVHEGHQQVAQFHPGASGRADMPQRTFQRALHARGLHDLFRRVRLRNLRHFLGKEFVKRGGQRLNVSAASGKNAAPLLRQGHAIEKVFHGQHFVLPFLHGHDGQADDFLNIGAQHGV